MRLGFISTMGKKTPAFLHFPALVLNGLTISALMTFAPSAPPGLMTASALLLLWGSSPKAFPAEGLHLGTGWNCRVKSQSWGATE